MNGNEHKPASGIEKNAGTDNENIGKKTPKAVPEEELVFYYNRAERLERAGENVRRYYDGTAPKPPKGLFKALVHTKQSRVMLFAVALSALVVLAVAFLTGKTDSQSADGVRFRLKKMRLRTARFLKISFFPLWITIKKRSFLKKSHLFTTETKITAGQFLPIMI